MGSEEHRQARYVKRMVAKAIAQDAQRARNEPTAEQQMTAGAKLLRALSMAAIDLAEHKTVMDGSDLEGVDARVDVCNFTFQLFYIEGTNGDAIAEALATALQERGYFDALKEYRDRIAGMYGYEKLYTHKPETEVPDGPS